MNPQTQERQPHAVLELPSRNQKGMKIERPHAPATRWLRAMPDALLKPWRRIIPTLICGLSR